MENKEQNISNVLYGTTLFLGAFLLCFFWLIMGKLTTNQFMGSPNAFSYTMIFGVFTLILGKFISKIIKKLDLRFQVLSTLILLLASLLSFKIPFEFKTLFDFATLNTFQSFSIILLKFMLFLSTGIIVTLFSTKNWLKIEKKENELPFSKIAFLGAVLPLYFYPFVYESALSFVQNFKVLYIGLCVFFTLYFAISILFIFKTQDYIKADDDEKTTYSKNALIISSLYGFSLGAIFIIGANYININTISAPFVWSFIIFPLVLAMFNVFKNHKISDLKWNLTLFYVLFLLMVLLQIKEMSYMKNPVVMTFLAIMFLYSTYLLLFKEFKLKQENFDNKTYTNEAFLISAFLGMLFSNVIIPVIFKSEIEQYFVVFFVLIYTIYLFISRYMKNVNLTHETKEHLILICCLSVVALSPFIKIKFLKYCVREQIRDFYSLYEIKTERHSATYILNSNNRNIGFQGVQKQQMDITPAAFNSPYTGAATIIKILQAKKPNGIRAGIVNLNVGSYAPYFNENDKVAFFEQNEKLIDLINKEYTFIKSTKAKTTIVKGNPRITIEQSPIQNFDIMIVDLTANKNNPTMFVTEEAIKTYMKQMNQEGVIVFNVSRKNLNFTKILKKFAIDRKLDYTMTLTEYPKKLIGNFNSQYFAIYMPKCKIQNNMKKIDYKNQANVIVKNVNLDNIKEAKRPFEDGFSNLKDLITPDSFYVNSFSRITKNITK